jgi:hypothetical protein
MIGGPCCRCVNASWVESMGHRCRAQNRPATGNGCYWFRCRDRWRNPDGAGWVCTVTGAVLSFGPCRADCPNRQDAERWRRC